MSKIQFMKETKYSTHKLAIETAIKKILNDKKNLYPALMKIFGNAKKTAIALLVYFNFCTVTDLESEITPDTEVKMGGLALDNLMLKTSIEFIPLKHFQRKKLGIKILHPYTTGIPLTKEQEEDSIFKL